MTCYIYFLCKTQLETSWLSVTDYIIIFGIFLNSSTTQIYFLSTLHNTHFENYIVFFSTNGSKQWDCYNKEYIYIYKNIIM